MKISDPQKNNSAGRLLAFLSSIEKGQQLWEILPQMTDAKFEKNSTKDAIPAAYEVLRELNAAYLIFLSDIRDHDLPSEFRETVLSGLSGLWECIYPQSLTNTFRPVNDAERALLKVAASMLPTEEQLPEDDLTRIRQSIADLLQLVETGAISPTLRKALLEIIRISEESILRYKIRGARGLKQAWNAMFTEAADLFRKCRTDEEAASLKLSPAFQKIQEHILLFDTIASRLLKYQPLIEQAAQILIAGH